jgi:cell division protein FtsW
MGAGTVSGWLKKIGVELPDNSGKRLLRLEFDVPLVLLTISLVVFGLLMVYSASWDFAYKNQNESLYYFERQVYWLLLGIVALFAGALIKFTFWTRLALPGLVISIVGLILVLLIGDERHGAIRGLSAGSYQPSELAKLAIIIYLSVWLYNRRDQLKDVWLGLIPLGTILGVVGGLITLQPDLSAVMTIGLLGMLMFFLAGGDLRQIILLVVFGFLIGVVVYNVMPNARVRIDFYWSGVFNLLEAHPHVQRALEAFVNGGWFGVGIGKSMTKLTGLPFPHTDSIFAVIGEEVGTIGSSFLVLAYLGILWRGLRIASRSQDQLGRLLAAGLTFWIAMEALINMGVMVGLLPFAGNALPLISSGGSNMLVTLAAIGIMLNISRQVEQTQVQEERAFDAIVDLRRRDRRRSVSRPGRSTSAATRK